MKLILENWQKFVNEELLEEGPYHTLASNSFSKAMKAVPDNNPEAKLQKA